MGWRTTRPSRETTRTKVCPLAPSSSPASRPCTCDPPPCRGPSSRRTFSRCSTFCTGGTRGGLAPGCQRSRNKKPPRRPPAPFPRSSKARRSPPRVPTDCRPPCPIVDDVATSRSRRLDPSPESCRLVEPCRRTPWIHLPPGPSVPGSGWGLGQTRWLTGRTVASRWWSGRGRLSPRCTRCHRDCPALLFARRVPLHPDASWNRPPFAPSFCLGSSRRISLPTRILEEKSVLVRY